jgi:hypothetical protein
MTNSRLREIIERHLLKVLEYDPFERFEGVTNKRSFLQMLSNDPAFAPFFLNNSKYVTARIGGNLITSLHRKLGDMYEEIFRALLETELGIPEEELRYSLTLNIDGKLQQRSTDGVIRYAGLGTQHLNRVKALQTEHDALGMAFEVRSCYQIGDSKRIQADRDMALALRKQNLEPVMLIFCASSLSSPVKRLKEYWRVYEGKAAFEFVKTLTGFDLFDYLQKEQNLIRKIMDKIFAMM